MSKGSLILCLGMICWGCEDGDVDSDPMNPVPIPTDAGLGPDMGEMIANDAMADDALADDAMADDALADVMPVDADLPEPDQGEMDPEALPPTWVDCHLAARDDTMDDDMVERCDALHAEGPRERLYGIRFVFLDDVGEVMDWIQPRLDAANRIFAPAGIEFTVASTVQVEGEVEYLTGDQELSLGNRLGDLRGHLEMPNASIDELLATLGEKLSQSGAAEETVDPLSADTVFTDQLFMQLMARAHPEDIYLAVGTVSERQGAGGQAPPPFHPIATLQRSVVSIKPSTPDTVPAHELGHYFGLKHPHAGSGRQPHLFAARQTENRYRAAETHDLMTVLENHFGADFSGPVGAPFVPYDADASAIADFEALRFALMDTWVRWRLTYAGERVPFATYGDFITAWRERMEMGMSNFMATEDGRQINNCSWQNDLDAFACTYPESDTPVEADEPILDGYVLFEDGTNSNVMSYIRQNGRGAPARNFGLFEEQIDLIAVSANAPQRLALRNYAQ